jgi:hypothetical protein
LTGRTAVLPSRTRPVKSSGGTLDGTGRHAVDGTRPTRKDGDGGQPYWPRYHTRELPIPTWAMLPLQRKIEVMSRIVRGSTTILGVPGRGNRMWTSARCGKHERCARSTGERGCEEVRLDRTNQRNHVHRPVHTLSPPAQSQTGATWSHHSDSTPCRLPQLLSCSYHTESHLSN